MFRAVVRYFESFADELGRGWNRFWFTPSDPIVLGVLRAAVGAMALYVCFSYSFDLVRFFGPDGLVTSELVSDMSFTERLYQRRVNHADYLLAVNYLKHVGDSPTMLWITHTLGLAVLGMMTVGFRSRLTSILGLVVTLTYVHRAPMLTSQLEPILCLVMFYVCLGPSGAAFSLDRWLAKRKKPIAGPQAETAYRTGATVAVRLMQVHLTIVYALMGLSKIAAPGGMSDVWWNGDAAWWLIARHRETWIDLSWLHAHPYVLDAWTQGIVLFELSFALLVWYRLFRPLVLALAVVMWIALALMTGLVAFCLMMLAANLAFASPAAVRSLLPWPRDGGPQPAASPA